MSYRFNYQNFLSISETIIQLHGDEDIDYCKNKRKNSKYWPMEGFRIKTEKDLDQIKPFEDFVDAILLDSWNKKLTEVQEKLIYLS